MWIRTSITLVFAALLGSACTKATSTGGSNSQPHWLTTCANDDGCGGLSCICGVCIEPCQSDGTCDVPGLSTMCQPPDAIAVEELCGAPAPMPICLSPCGLGCAAGLDCVDGVCIGKLPPVPTDGGAGDGCDYNGKHYDVGDSFKSSDGCNDCGCEKGGSVACTARACLDGGAADGCIYEGKKYPVDSTFPSSDGCNRCGCSKNGQVACTLIACLDGGPAPGLTWYQTCGAPVCGPQFDGPTGEALCSNEKVGEACSTEGTRCDPSLGCAVNLVCAASDPTMGTGGCPISRARYKDDIRYLSERELADVARRLMATPLAHWRYKHDASGKEQMGFIIEDVEPSPSVDGDHVNLYGYTSMAVAALKVQDDQLKALEREVQAMRAHLLELERSCGAR